ncbi:TRAP-type mannitol/chloroaromatic compound transport system permease small subunit [Mycolicibacterium sp. BK634]|uniref:CD225/dispanin family protein n=1 Tax=Mycolicibacterium sp. BK634 TaxID=2587099 RepID=UPI0016183A4A|nr:CD225/dispanin family protein [Mycolicibacterium sp. BK634]MBB3754438.1 TRAP-type mannitol/chloroaromatic compound transport system permease small subunit [Mycolicibacterium sp. BK634]
MTQQPPPAQAPNNHLVGAILTLLFCFPITGIVAIIKASQVNGLWAQGQYQAAQESADSAKKWVRLGIIIGIILWIIGIIAYVLLAVALVKNGDIPES